MVKNEAFQSRIDYEGNLQIPLSQVCHDYGIGNYQSYEIIPFGYEDFNLALNTDRGQVFVKIFASFRSNTEVQEIVTRMQKAMQAGVQIPNLHESSQGYLYRIMADGKELRLCVMEWIEGETFYQLGTKPDRDEVRFLAHQAALTSVIDLKPELIYDTWAIPNFLEEYEKKKQYLSEDEGNLIEPLVQLFSQLNLDKLPHSFVHGDIISTNVMRSNDGKLYILDFSAANWYPRIQELTVLACDLLFDPQNLESFRNIYNLALSEYQKSVKLTPEEIEVLPLYLAVAHAMHLLNGTYEKVSEGNNSEENQYFIDIGRKGLEFMQSFAPEVYKND